MEEALEFIRKLSQDKQLAFFQHRNEVWLSGYKDGLKVDIFIKFFKDGKVKFVYEIPQERKVALFLNKDSLIRRLKSIMSYEVV